MACFISSFYLDEIDNSIKPNLLSLEVGQISDPIYYKSPDGKEGYRIISLVEKIDAHYANINNDFSLIKMYAD